MTLIVTHISKFGIIHASDSNLTSGIGQPAGQARKTFPIPHLNAGLTIAGAYSVNGTSMDTWMNSFISGQGGTTTLRSFAETLRASLESQMTSSEKNNGSMVHIAGYVEEAGRQHPEFYFVRNVYGINQTTGEYYDLRQNFQITEDFWTRDCPARNLMAAFQSGISQIYINGFTSGRVGFIILQEKMNEFFQTIWNQPTWKFRPPNSLAEAALIVKLYLNTIDTLFQLSDYGARYIGGDPQLHEIPQPPNTVDSC